LNDDGDIIENFSSLLNGFIEDNPKDFTGEVEKEWLEKDISKKLIFESPIPLNDEQKQVLIALQKPDCKFMILEGPPGTGKSHTITAIICKALLEEKSVLVLSDKKEALDVVEEKISNTLNKIRHGDNFQNPILRLGKTGNKFYKIVQGQTIQEIKEHYYAYKHNKTEYDEHREKSLIELENNISGNIKYFDDINIKDIELYFQGFNKFSTIDWINSTDEYKIDLLRIKKGIEKICQHNNNLKIDKNILNDTNYKLLNKYKNSLHILSESKVDFKEKNKNIDVDVDVLIAKFGNHTPYDEKTLSTLKSIKTIQSELKNLYKDKPTILKLFKSEQELNLITLTSHSDIINISLDLFTESKKFLGNKFTNYNIFTNFEIPEGTCLEKAIAQLKEYIDNLNEIKWWHIISKNKAIKTATQNLKKTFSYFGIENPKKYSNAIQQISDWFYFIYEKTPNKYKENEGCLYTIFIILIDLLENNNDEYLSDYSEIKQLQNKIVVKKQSIEALFANITNLEYEIQQVSWNIEVFKQINNIDHIVHELSNMIPDNLKIGSNDNCSIFFSSNINNSLNNFIELINEFRSLKDDIDFILEIKEKHPNFSKKINLNILSTNINVASSILSNHTDEEIKEYLKHKKLQLKLEEQFNSPPEDRFSNSINEIEYLTTTRMAYLLDKRIIDYTQNYANEVGTLKNIVRKKQKFPKELFQNLKKAFPCILAGIRDYAEFIPLEKDLFDLIIIDEASQVSIAQALPALVRGKQIIVLGDDKQFSNVKASNASKVTNQELRKKVQDTFLKERLNGVDKNGWLTKVKENFDIKNSILKFSRFIRNYECQLKKHFRCYPEIISYSDNHFYQNTLQCMKIRGNKIEDVIKFEIIDNDGKFDQNKNTNELEANHIIEKLQEFKKQEIEQSIGIITPHREQVTLLFDKIEELPARDWLFKKCKLKIMTFDTCQGEERDYIFYSMVATKEKDKLNYIFLKNFSSISDEPDGTIKSQRMNVGFSRAKECIHFVLSKPIEQFQGEIKNAILHYQNELKNAKEGIVKKLDSKMEYKVYEIFYSTKFYKENKDKIEFIPQFELGKYLKQLNTGYNHPNYKVDFLLKFDKLKIVIEYDGFKEHFIDREEVNESNYKYYMKDDDIYRQKVLEGYGYKFLRINRFNIGDNPVETLDNRLQNLLKKNLKIS
jgi:very-short-patch-repair endonuclease